MTSQEPERREETINPQEASALLGVPPDRIQVLMEEGLLTPVADTREPRFRRAEVLAVRDLGA